MASDSDLAKSALANVTRWGPTGWGRVRCPFCPTRRGTPDRRGSLGFNGATGGYHCFRCGIKGKVFIGAPLVDPNLAKSAAGNETIEAMEAPEGYVPLGEEPYLSSVSFSPQLQWLASRGVDALTVQEARIGYVTDEAPEEERMLRDRILVPILADDEWTWRGFSARVWEPPPRPTSALGKLLGLDGAAPPPRRRRKYKRRWVKPKYVYPKGMDRQTLLYNSAALRRVETSPVLLVEGVFDALPYWPDAVAVLGKPSPGQMDALIQAQRPIVVALDGDAWKQARWLARKLQWMRRRNPGPEVSWVRLPPREDPGSVDPAWLFTQAESSLRAGAPGQSP